MADTTWGDIYKGGGDRRSVDAGTYSVLVAGVRPLPQSSLIFLDLEVQEGPKKGEVGQVNLYVPGPWTANRGGAEFNFLKKAAGMLASPPVGFAEAVEAADKDRALNLLADALDGRRFTAVLTVVNEPGGKYDGNNELDETKPLDGETPTPAAEAAAPGPAAAVVAPDVAALEAQLAAAKAVVNAAGQDSAPAPAAAPALSEDAPF